MDEESGVFWLDDQLRLPAEAAIVAGSWILDMDTTVKCFYGKQKGAVVSSLSPERRPALIRGDIFLGNEGFLAAAESRSA
jgi:hypothetical protein